MKKQVKKIIGSICLLVLFTTYQAGITAFTHVHYINGVIITHSHPFQGEHTHSKTEIVVIDRLSTFHALEADTFDILHPMQPLLNVPIAERTTPLNKGGIKQALSLRGPPALAA